MKSWEKDLKKKICKELIKQGFEIEFAEGIVARTLKELEIILNCLDELGVELL